MNRIIYRGYTPWIEMRASDTYQAVVADERATINRLMAERGGSGRLPALTKTFHQRRGSKPRSKKMAMLVIGCG